MCGVGERIAIARLVAPFGIKGYLKVRLFSEDPKRLASLKRVYIGSSPETSTPGTIDDVLIQHNGIMLKLAEVPDRTAAERMAGNFLFVEETETIHLPKGSYFIHELIGCTVQSADGKELGILADVQQYPAQDIWSIAYEGKTVMIPAVKEFIKSVDIGQRVIVVQHVEGFFEE